MKISEITNYLTEININFEYMGNEDTIIKTFSSINELMMFNNNLPT